MNFVDFSRELKGFPAFSLRDTAKLRSKVYHHRLVDWQKKGYITRVANGIYLFNDSEVDELYLYYLSGRVYEPSYISLESAFAYYGFIPESVYRITAVSTRKTWQSSFNEIIFSYRTISKDCFFGYDLLNWKNTVIKMAEPEKAIIDYFYLNPGLNSPEKISGMRFNAGQIMEQTDWQKLKEYLVLCRNKALEKRMYIFERVIKEHD